MTTKYILEYLASPSEPGATLGDLAVSVGSNVRRLILYAAAYSSTWDDWALSRRRHTSTTWFVR